MALGGVYDTGTISIDAAGTAVVGVGTLWSVSAEEGDWIFANGHIGLVDTVTDDTNIVLASAWTGGALSASTYKLIKMSWLRYDASLTQQKVREFLTYMDGIGFFYFVSGTVPDASLGEEGQFALKVNSGQWKLWYKTGGSWELQGVPAGVTFIGTWDVAHTYAMGDGVYRLGNAYVSLRPTVGDPPESSELDWALWASGGSRYDLLVWDNGKPTSGETLIRAPMAVEVVYPAGLTDSQAEASTASTGTAVLSLQKNGTEFGTVTFTASAIGVYAAASGTTFAIGDIFTVVAPNPQDATLAGVALTITGYRNPA